MGAGAVCPFCDIVQGKPEGRTSSILFQDDKLVAFEDRNPAAFKHYLVVPVEHIKNVNSLSQEHYGIVDQMLKLGESLLQRDAPEARHRFGFHRPPINSVSHLHLHCIALPYRSWWRRMKYTSLGCWWMSANNVLWHLGPQKNNNIC